MVVVEVLGVVMVMVELVMHWLRLVRQMGMVAGHQPLILWMLELL